MWWSVVAAVGTRAIVLAVAQAAIALLLTSIDPRTALLRPASGAILVAAAACGGAVAWRTGGWRGLAGYLAALVALEILRSLATAPARAIFCERSGAPCPLTDEVAVIVARWPEAAAAAAGALVLARAVATGTGRANGALEAAGVFALTSSLLPLLVFAAVPPDLSGQTLTSEHAPWIALSLVTLVIALACGHLLVRRGARPWPGAGTVSAALFVAGWLPTALRDRVLPPYRPAELDWLMIAPLAYGLALVLGATLTAALARPRPPGGDAARRAAR